jgi:surfeit locus 1 family protein
VSGAHLLTAAEGAEGIRIMSFPSAAAAAAAASSLAAKVATVSASAMGATSTSTRTRTLAAVTAAARGGGRLGGGGRGIIGRSCSVISSSVRHRRSAPFLLERRHVGSLPTAHPRAASSNVRLSAAPVRGSSRWLSSSSAAAAGSEDSTGAASNNNPLSTAGKLFFGSLCVGTFALGCWQTSRLFEKRQLIEERSKELGQPPVSVSTVSKDAIRPGSFQRLVLEGQYDHARELLVGPRGSPPAAGGGSSSYGGNMPSPQGYFVVTPFVTSEGDVFLVNRGWVPRNAVVPTLSPQQQQQYQQQQHRQRRREQEEAARGGSGSRPSPNVSNAPPPSPSRLQWSRPSGTTAVHAVPSILESTCACCVGLDRCIACVLFLICVQLVSLRIVAEPRFLVANHNYRERPVQLYWFDVDAMQQLVQRNDAMLVTSYNDNNNQEAGQDDSDSESLLRPVRPTLESLQEFKVSPAIHAAYAFTWFSLSLAGLIMTRRLAISASSSASSRASAASTAASAAAAAAAAARNVR